MNRWQVRNALRKEGALFSRAPITLSDRTIITDKPPKAFSCIRCGTEVFTGSHRSRYCSDECSKGYPKEKGLY